MPALTSGATCSEELSEWVGVDGFSNDDLIQAGVGESMVGPYDNETCTAGTYYVWAWWEILPASETPIVMTVHAGDSVTVQLSQVSSGEWDIRIVDNTADETFNQEEAYSAAMSSAEWIVEAPYDTYVCGPGGYCVPDPYSPAVPFSAISATGAVGTAYDVEMEQTSGNSSVDYADPNLVQSWPSSFTDSYIGPGNTGRRSAALARRMVSRPARGRKLSHHVFQG